MIAFPLDVIIVISRIVTNTSRENEPSVSKILSISPDLTAAEASDWKETWDAAFEMK